MINAVIVPCSDCEFYFIYKYSRSVKVCFVQDDSILDILDFPAVSDNGEDSYTVTEVVRIVQFHVDNQISF